MATTYELTMQASDLLAHLEDSGGELTPEAEASLDAWLEAAPDKLGGIRAVLARFKADAALLKAEARRLTDRARALGNAEQRLKGCAVLLLEAHEELTGEAKVKRPDFSAWLATTKSVRGPDNVWEWPAHLRVEQDPRPNKKAAGLLLKAGEELDGITLVETRGVRFR